MEDQEILDQDSPQEDSVESTFDEPTGRPASRDEPTPKKEKNSTRQESEKKSFGQKVDEHSRLIQEMENTVRENLMRGIAIMTVLENETDKLMIFKGTTEEIQDRLSDILSIALEDTKRINGEAQVFLARIADHKKPQQSETPFLAQIWSGEMYGDGHEHFGGIKRLVKELKKTNAFFREVQQDLSKLDRGNLRPPDKKDDDSKNPKNPKEKNPKEKVEKEKVQLKKKKPPVKKEPLDKLEYPKTDVVLKPKNTDTKHSKTPKSTVSRG
jgi:hypothetical protein